MNERRVCLYEWCWLCGSAYTNVHYINPLGCMFLVTTKKKWPTWKRMLLKLALIPIYPLILIFGIPIVFCLILWEEKITKRVKRRRGLLIAPIILLGLVLILVCAALLPLIIIFVFICYCTEREKFMRKHRERLREKNLLI